MALIERLSEIKTKNRAVLRGAAWLKSLTMLVTLGTGAAVAAEERPRLRFGTDGNFKILVIADVQETDEMAAETEAFILGALDSEQPDLVIFLGDNLAGMPEWGVSALVVPPAERVRAAIDHICKPVNNRKIPFAVIFGNHDYECGFSKEEQLKLYQSYPYCIAADEGEAVAGCGTYVLPVNSSLENKPAMSLYFFDSLEYTSRMNKGSHPTVGQDLIDWYIGSSNEIKENNGGRALPAMAFQHIIIPEIYNAFMKTDKETPGALEGWGNRKGVYYALNPATLSDKSRIDSQDPGARYGAMNHIPICPNMEENETDREFAAWKQQGDIFAAFFGHDHTNEFLVQHEGIDLAACPGTGGLSYGAGMERSMRVITLNEQNIKDYQTRLVFLKDIVPDCNAEPVSMHSTYIRYGKMASPYILSLIAIPTLAGVLLRRRKKKK